MTGHRYGPHRPEDAPTTVTIGTFRKWEGDERDVPIHTAVLRQREHINQLAHEATAPPSDPQPPTTSDPRADVAREALRGRTP